MEWVSKTPVLGDIVRTKVTFYHHYGIFVDEETIIQFGMPDNVTQNAADIRVLSSDVAAFLRGGEMEVGVPDQQERKKLRNPWQIVEIARSRLGEDGYDLLHNNCEHFVNECAFGEKTSSFLQGIRVNLRQKLGKE